VYVESQQGNIRRIDIETRDGESIRPNKNNIVNYDAYVTQELLEMQEKAGWGKDNPFRFNWSCPIIISHHRPNMVYFGGNFLFKTMDRGESWEIISPDLSTQDPVKIDRKTGGLTPDVTGAENHCSIITVSESPFTPELIWVGTDDGNVQVTRNGGKSWANVRENVPGVPDGIWVSRVEASRFDEGTCYLTFDGHRSDNFTPWVFKTTDYGTSWTNIGGSLPDGQVAYVIREDLINRDLLFVGTEFGLFASPNGGQDWMRFMNNLPTVAVHDIMIHPLYHDLIIGTHGRGIWICDDITALQQMNKSIAASEGYLFDSRLATQWHSLSRGGSRGQFLFQGENPPRGAMVHYYLGEGVEEATLEISDFSGEMTFPVKLEGKPGINRYIWNYRFNPPELNDAEQKLLEKYIAATEWQERRAIGEEMMKSLEERGQKFAGVSRRDNTLNPIPAEPGVYKVTLKVGDRVMVKTLSVREDPMLK
jgi:hypothetical protein